MDPNESTPAGNTRRRAAVRRTESSSSVGSELLDATIVHHAESEPVSIDRRIERPASAVSEASPARHHRPTDLDARPLRTESIARPRTLDSTPDPNIAALLQSMSQLQSMFAAQSNTLAAQLDSRMQLMFATQSSTLTAQLDAQATAMTVLTDRLNRIEQSQQTRPDRVTVNPNPPAAAAPRSSTTIAEIPRDSMSNSHRTPPIDAILDPMVNCALAPESPP